MPEFEGQKFSVPSQGATRPDASPLTALEVYQGIQERQTRALVVSRDQAIIDLTERIEILERQQVKRHLLTAASLVKISNKISAFMHRDWREVAIYNAPGIGAAAGFAAVLVLGELQVAGMIDLHLANPGSLPDANAFRFLNAFNLGFIGILGGNAIGFKVGTAILDRRESMLNHLQPSNNSNSGPLL